MKKTFCDGCGREMEFNGNHIDNGKLEESKKLEVELHFGRYNERSQEWHGDWCIYCALDAIAKLDDRPKDPPPHSSGTTQVNDSPPDGMRDA